MSTLSKFTAHTSGDIICHYELDEAAQPLVQSESPPQATIKSLLDHEQFYEAVKFIAHGLPKREAVWWACLAAQTAQSSSDAANQKALQAAEKWVRDPNEDHRRLAEKLAQQTGLKTAASWAAMAAFWSNGSITNPGEPPIAAAPYLYAHAVAGAVGLAAATGDDEETKQNFIRLIKAGLDIASGGDGRVH